MSRDRDPKISELQPSKFSRSYPFSTIILPSENSFPLVRNIFQLKKIRNILENSSSNSHIYLKKKNSSSSPKGISQLIKYRNYRI